MAVMDPTTNHPGVGHRQPLSDVTKRVNHSIVANVSHREGVCDDENYDPSKSKNVARGRSNPTLAVHPRSVEQSAHHTPAVAVTAEPGPVDPRLSAIARDSRGTCDSRRVSQFSNVSSNASSTRQLKTHIGPWQLGKTLGKGSSARVRLARHRVSHQLVAIKIVAKSTAHITQAGSLANVDRIDIRKPTTSADGGLRRMPLAIEREVAILKLIGHPNIIKLLDIWENRSEIYLVTEYVEKGDLFEFINWNGPLNEEEAIFYFRQIMSALEYCHSFNICHRDLKPENILLKSNGQIKIADFGMAALHQGPNHQLRTACGSPHYAAPELLRHQFYKGSAADIWSMGVILFAMLAGRLPFDDDDMAVMLSKAKRAEYRMPPHLTREAKDLIRRILVDQPARRITMKQMWRHALIRKYDYLEQYYKWDEQPDNKLRHRDVAPISEEQVDIQILRQLKALWHSFSEFDLKEKLKQERPNDQKLFYWLLYNHREAQLENYNNNVPISKSDFHHLKPPNWVKRISTCQFTQPGRKGHARTVSRFTVISNVPDVDDAGTIRSYDPYNASRVFQPCPSQASHAKIIVHRNSPEQGIGMSPTSISHSYRSYRSAAGSIRQRQRMNSQRAGTAGHMRSSMSTTSSIRSHHSTPRVRVNSRPKRGVDFSNVRNKGQRHHQNRRGSLAGPASIAGDSTTYDRGSLSLSIPPPPQESMTKGAAAAHSTVEVREPADSSFIWDEELEQLGHLIAQDCDEAFRIPLLLPEPSEAVAESREASPFALSLGSLSAIRVSEEPALSNKDLAGARPWDNRPLPPVRSHDAVSPPTMRSSEPNAETGLQAETPAIPDSSFRAAPPERRVVSEPVYNRLSKDARLLPSIHESSLEDWKRRNLSSHNMASSLDMPTRVKNKGLDYLARVENTIRVVSSPTTAGALGPVKIPEPLNVRKVSRSAGTTKPRLSSSSGDPRRDTSGGSHQNSQLADGGSCKAPRNRVSSWFKRASKADASSSSFATVTHTSIRSRETLTDFEARRQNQPVSYLADAASSSGAQKKKVFGLQFWKSAKDEPKMSLAGPDYTDTYTHENDEPTNCTANKTEYRIDADANPNVWSNTDGGIRKIEVQQNWLARLFRVKPARRYLCFNIPKRHARQEVAILLREWRKYGIKDIEVDKERNIIFARLAAKNYLNLKEVSFAIELMTVIEHGKRNQLSIARFTQEKGAASSFHKVVDAVNSVFMGRGLVITDKRKVSMMIKTLNS